MNPEVPIAEKDRKQINWNQILRYSFMFSQGSDLAQTQILKWIANGPLLGEKPTEDDFTLGTVSNYAAKAGIHAPIQIKTLDGKPALGMESGWRNNLIKIFNAPEGANTNLIVQGIIEKDLLYLNNGRPTSIERGGRDRWSSFAIDFGILRKGTEPWIWSTIPDAYKQMWEVITPLFLTSFRGDLFAIVKLYLEKHPDLAEEDRRKIDAFIAG